MYLFNHVDSLTSSAQINRIYSSMPPACAKVFKSSYHPDCFFVAKSKRVSACLPRAFSKLGVLHRVWLIFIGNNVNKKGSLRSLFHPTDDLLIRPLHPTQPVWVEHRLCAHPALRSPIGQALSSPFCRYLKVHRDCREVRQ